MFLVRDVMYCKPGQVRTLVDKFKQLQKLGESVGMPRMRLMTDVVAEQYWTLVSEMEVESLEKWEKMVAESQTQSAEMMKKFESAMQGYHDLVVRGKREIYRIEG